MKSSRIIIVILAVIFSLGLAWGIRWTYDNKISNFDRRFELFITPETSLDQIMAQLDTGAKVKRPGSLVRVFRQKQVEQFRHTGHYVISPGHTSVYVARMLNNGWQTPVNLTLSGSMRRRGRIADKIGTQLMLKSSDVLDAMSDSKFLERYGVTPATVYSMIIPDTYQVYWDITMEQLFDRFYQEYNRFWNDSRRKKRRNWDLHLYKSASWHPSSMQSPITALNFRLLREFT